MSGMPEVRERRAVAQRHERVDDRLRVHDDVDAVVRRAEQVVRLDHLEALVHQRRRVDRDLAAHRPGRVPQRLLDGDGLELGARAAAERAAGRGQHEPVDRARRARRRSAGAARSARSRPGSAARRSPRRAPSRAPRRRPATPCWRARRRCPRSARRSSGPSPAEPTIALSTRSASESATSRTRPSGPASTSPSVHASAARAAASASDSAMRRTPWARACATSGWRARVPADRPTSSKLARPGHHVERLRSDRAGGAEDQQPLHRRPIVAAGFSAPE